MIQRHDLGPASNVPFGIRVCRSPVDPASQRGAGDLVEIVAREGAHLRAHLRVDAEVRVQVEAEGVFKLPKTAREESIPSAVRRVPSGVCTGCLHGVSARGVCMGCLHGVSREVPALAAEVLPDAAEVIVLLEEDREVLQLLLAMGGLVPSAWEIGGGIQCE